MKCNAGLKWFKRLFPIIMGQDSKFDLTQISSFFTIVCHQMFKTNVLIIHRFKESTLLCMSFLVPITRNYKKILVLRKIWIVLFQY